MDDAILLELSLDEYRIVLESLMFSSYVDVTGNFYKDDLEKMRSLLFELKSLNPDIIVKNVEVVTSSESFDTYFDEDVKNLIENFPEIDKKI